MYEPDPNNSYLYVPLVLILLLIYAVFSLIKGTLAHSLKTELIKWDENHSVITDHLSMWVASYLTSTLGILTMLWYLNYNLHRYQYIIPTWPYLLLIVLICILLYFYNFTSRYFVSIMHLTPIFCFPSIIAIPFMYTHYTNFYFPFIVFISYFLFKIAFRKSWSLKKVLVIFTVVFSLIILTSLIIPTYPINWDLNLYRHKFNYSYLYYYIMYAPVLIVFYNYNQIAPEKRNLKLMSIHYLAFLYFPLLVFMGDPAYT